MMSITPPPNQSSKRNRNQSSDSIPIVQCEAVLREDIELYQQTVHADHVDLAFCTRLVDGMRKQQRYQQKPSTIFQNQVVIDHIIDTRRGVDGDVADKNSNYNPYQQVASPSWFDSSYRSDDGSRMSQSEEDMIFDMDL